MAKPFLDAKEMKEFNERFDTTAELLRKSGGITNGSFGPNAVHDILSIIELVSVERLEHSSRKLERLTLALIVLTGLLIILTGILVYKVF